MPSILYRVLKHHNGTLGSRAVCVETTSGPVTPVIHSLIMKSLLMTKPTKKGKILQRYGVTDRKQSHQSTSEKNYMRDHLSALWELNKSLIICMYTCPHFVVLHLKGLNQLYTPVDARIVFTYSGW